MHNQPGLLAIRVCRPRAACSSAAIKAGRSWAHVLEDGFEYNGKSYGSLSAIAHRVTGTRWNGYVFFGLRQEPKQ